MFSGGGGAGVYICRQVSFFSIFFQIVCYQLLHLLQMVPRINLFCMQGLLCGRGS